VSKKNKIKEIKMHQHRKLVRGVAEVFGAPHQLDSVHSKTNTIKAHTATVQMDENIGE